MKNFKDFSALEELGEAHKLGDKVIINKGPSYVVGKTGHIGEIRRHYIGAPKTYTIDHDDGSIQLKSTHFRAVKESFRPMDEPKYDQSIQARQKKADDAKKKEKKKAVAEAKDAGEYDQEGDMAMTQLRSIIYHAQELHDQLSENDNLPEWVQSKITLAQDYMQTACDYMYSQKAVKEESINELSSDLLARYKEKAGMAATAADKAGKYDIGHKRFKGILKATFKQFANDAKKNG